MAGLVLRVRLMSGERIDVTHAEPDTTDQDELIERVLTTLADPEGRLPCRHGGRLVVLFSRGVAAVEVAPRGPVL